MNNQKLGVSDILKLDEKIEYIKCEIIAQYPEGIDTEEMVSLVKGRVSVDLLENITNFISNLVEEMAIFAEVTYDLDSERFKLDFRVRDDGSTYGKVVELGLEEILTHKFTYQKNIKDWTVNSKLDNFLKCLAFEFQWAKIA